MERANSVLRDFYAAQQTEDPKEHEAAMERHREGISRLWRPRRLDALEQKLARLEEGPREPA
jgi:hypothetical protein